MAVRPWLMPVHAEQTSAGCLLTSVGPQLTLAGPKRTWVGPQAASTWPYPTLPGMGAEQDSPNFFPLGRGRPAQRWLQVRCLACPVLLGVYARPAWQLTEFIWLGGRGAKRPKKEVAKVGGEGGTGMWAGGGVVHEGSTTERTLDGRTQGGARYTPPLIQAPPCLSTTCSW